MLPVVILIIIMVISFIFLAAKQATDKYFPYEGKVISIEKKWYDSFLFETNDDEHLIIETASGEVIDRYMNRFDRINSRIEAGDFITKLQGFSQEVRARDKKTSEELMKDLEMQNKSR